MCLSAGCTLDLMLSPSLAVMRSSVQFFREGLGLTVNVASETFAEVNAGPVTIALKASDRCAKMPSIASQDPAHPVLPRGR
jgi:hypothetical protein